MNSGLRPLLKRTDWKILYRAAVQETDKDFVQQRLAEAEEAVITRGRELFYGPQGTPEEEEALEDALYALRAYRMAWKHSKAA